MTTVQDTSLDDIAQAIADLSTMTATAIADLGTELRSEMNSLKTELRSEMTNLTAEQHETNQRLSRLEGKSDALEDDIKELYRMIEELRKDFEDFTIEERARFANLENFARQVSLKTGIPFTQS